MGDTMSSFVIDQLAHVLSQLIEAYSGKTWIVYANTYYSYSGTPLDLYSAPGADGPGFLRLKSSGEIYAIPLAKICAIYPGNDTVYDSSLTYLSAPDPLPEGYDANMAAAVQSYLPTGTDAVIYLSTYTSASGTVYRNEYGILVLSDNDGNTPVFICSVQIHQITTSD